MNSPFVRGGGISISYFAFARTHEDYAKTPEMVFSAHMRGFPLSADKHSILHFSAQKSPEKFGYSKKM